ncbi:MAG: PIN domain-containing protein [Chloroflexota bacterium]
MQSESSDPFMFIDSNIWLYVFQPELEPIKTPLSQKLIRENRTKIIMSSQVVVEVSSNLLKKYEYDEYFVYKFIYESYRRYKVINIDEEILVKASQIRQEHLFSYWDSIIASAALVAGATILYSEDMDTGLVLADQLTIVNPFEHKE